MGSPSTGPSGPAPKNPGLHLRWRQAARVGLVLLTGVLAGTVQAKTTDGIDLDTAVHQLALNLAYRGNLRGRTVLVNSRHFVDMDKRSLGLSAHLAAKFASALRELDVKVVASTDDIDAMILRGVWSLEPESGVLHLSMEVKTLVVEKHPDGRETARREFVAADDGRIRAGSIEGKYLAPDLESHALNAVRKLEKDIQESITSGIGRYRVHIESVEVEGVARHGKLRQRLVRYLRPAFADSREFTLVPSEETADGALRGEVSSLGEFIELALWIIDSQRREQVAAVTVKMREAEFTGLDVDARLVRIAEWTPEMVRIERGCFRMGSPQSEEGRRSNEHRHEVCVEAFSMGKHEVTRGQYAAFVRETERATGDACTTYESGEWKKRSGRSWRAPGYGQEDTHPVVCVSQEDATAYARWLSRRTGRPFRLPTEAEWELAARSGTETSRFWGDDPARACEYANVADHAIEKGVPGREEPIHGCTDGYVHTAPAGSFETNPWGLNDVLGNVWEWTCSEYDKGYGGAERRCAAGGAGRRALRGGAWFSKPIWTRSAYRYGGTAADRYSTLGFRLAQD